MHLDIQAQAAQRPAEILKATAAIFRIEYHLKKL
jgi:hypothetical protein